MVIEKLMSPDQWLQEKSTWYYTHLLTDELGNPVGSSQIDTLTLTFYSRDTPLQPVILDWLDKNVKAANGGTISNVGKFELRFTEVETIVLDPSRAYELRGLLLTWKTLTGKIFRHEVQTVIANLAKVP